MNHLFKQGTAIIHTLKKHGYEAYFVGGAVRDYILQRQIHDVDITTSATPYDIMKLFPNVIPVGVDHGTVIVRQGSVSFEVTTFRKPAFSSSRPTIEADVMGRDFTMNALLMTDSFEIIDYVNGTNDIEYATIQAVAHPDARFQEDPLRILRAFRFVSDLGFQLEKETEAAMKENKSLLTDIAVERIVAEWAKLISGNHVKQALQLLIKHQVHYYIPVFDQYPAILETVVYQVKPCSYLASFFAWLHLENKKIPIQEWVKAWNLSNFDKQAIRHIEEIAQLYDQEGMTDWFIYQLDKRFDAVFIEWWSLQQDRVDSLNELILTARRESLVILERKDLAIDGNKLLSLFPNKQAGIWMKEMLEKIEYLVVMKKIENKYEKIKEWILCHPPEIN